MEKMSLYQPHLQVRVEEKPLYLPYLLSALWRASFEGSVTLIEGGIQRKIYLRPGKVVNVVSQLQEETLGRCLLDEGEINQGSYNKLLELMVKTRQPAGVLLIAMNALSLQDIFRALERQVRRKLVNSFRMNGFRYSLEPGPVPPEELIVNIDLAEGISQGILEGYSMDQLLTEFPLKEKTEFRVRPMPGAGRMVTKPRVEEIYQFFLQGGTTAELMRATEDITQKLAALYALHALHLIDSDEIARPSTAALQLPDLVEPTPVVSSVESAETATEASSEEASLASDPRTQSMLLAKKLITLPLSDHFAVLEISPQRKGMELMNAYFRIVQTYSLQSIDETYPSEEARQMARTLLDRATMAYRELSAEDSRNAYLERLKTKTGPQDRPVSPRVLADVEAQKGELALGAKHYAEAEKFYQNAIDLYAEEPSYHFQLGLAGFQKAEEETPADQPLPERVRKPFLKALSINPNYEQPQLYLGYIAKRSGDLRTALADFFGFEL